MGAHGGAAAPWVWRHVGAGADGELTLTPASLEGEFCPSGFQLRMTSLEFQFSQQVVAVH